MRTIIILFTLAVLGSSCRTVPYYTTIEKMTAIKPGMKLDAVNSALAVTPHDYYLDVNRGKKIMVYKYKHRYHKILKLEIASERGLSAGAPRYRKPSDAYFVFDQNSGKLEGYITDLGRAKGVDVLNNENYLKLFLKDPEKMRGLSSGNKKGSGASNKKGKKRSLLGKLIKTILFPVTLITDIIFK
ncbi:MAG TPA: hypothetical protein EYN89_00605 [Flavobacteriales bacterium]|nr:hypothetical protein [Flavobacteriales bacterium]